MKKINVISNIQENISFDKCTFDQLYNNLDFIFNQLNNEFNIINNSNENINTKLTDYKYSGLDWNENSSDDNDIVLPAEWFAKRKNRIIRFLCSANHGIQQVINKIAVIFKKDVESEDRIRARFNKLFNNIKTNESLRLYVNGPKYEDLVTRLVGLNRLGGYVCKLADSITVIDDISVEKVIEISNNVFIRLDDRFVNRRNINYSPFDIIEYNPVKFSEFNIKASKYNSYDEIKKLMYMILQIKYDKSDAIKKSATDLTNKLNQIDENTLRYQSNNPDEENEEDTSNMSELQKLAHDYSNAYIASKLIRVVYSQGFCNEINNIVNKDISSLMKFKNK